MEILVNSGYATYQELVTVYSIEDAYNLLEIVSVRFYNEKMAMKLAQIEAERRAEAG